MKEPKLHHYVPQFYLKRFTDPSDGLLWVWDKTADRVFHANPINVAAEANFYTMQELAEAGHDPYTMEKQLSNIEGKMALVSDQWLYWFAQIELGTRIDIPEGNREAVSLYLAVQYLRTADTKDVLCRLSGNYETLSEAERTRLHTTLVWDLETVHKIRDWIKDCIWIFGRNETETPFITSDNPVAFRTPDNRQWRRAGFLDTGMYVVFPLSPSVVMYCHERTHWKKAQGLDSCLSPVVFDSEMVKSENSGQVFMALRFVFSPKNDFEHPRQFAPTIGTDIYAPKAD